MIHAGQVPYHLPELHLTREAHVSMALNRIRSGAVIMAGSGMCTAERARRHLRHNLAHGDCSVIFVGDAAAGTLARVIIDGARSVKLFRDNVPANAQIHTINGFSAHAGMSDLKRWHARTGKPELTFLVHGEERGKGAFAKALAPAPAETPRLHHVYDLWVRAEHRGGKTEARLRDPTARECLKGRPRSRIGRGGVSSDVSCCAKALRSRCCCSRLLVPQFSSARPRFRRHLAGLWRFARPQPFCSVMRVSLATSAVSRRCSRSSWCSFSRFC